ncbi:thiol reductant ABC exporter subunit CydC [Texcoconibacillus texcoconensis]|uniref:ATP-binding cassette subfamily C protein CydC n=1 Tax=Texcoconibacillus texcoconensis TaxID=1095777 RepID=A0A840QPW8_9BACI|nr:thiol reductant ABC exporter subunit CydC [Texcoconibacillus texcoconensis]MBB5173388.1 ATP-binding cassette subfamily C protein CydC [Texcoconibacillus texcoconensis]
MKAVMQVTRLIMIEKKNVFLAIVFGFLAAIASVGLLAASGYLISKSALQPPLYTLTATIIAVRFFGLLRAGSRYGERYFSHQATFTMLSHLRTYFYERIEPHAPGIFQKYRSGDLLSRVVGDVESLQYLFLRVVYPPIVMLIVFFSTILFTYFYSLYSALLLFIGFILTGFVIPAWFAVRERYVDANVREKRGDLSAEATELLYGFRDLKIHRQLEKREDEMSRASMDYINEQEKETIHQSYSETINSQIAFLITWFVLLVGAFSVESGQLDGVFLAMLVLISLTVFESATPMASFPSNYESSRHAAERLYTVTAESTPEEPPPHEDAFFMENIEISGHGITFRFPDQPRPVLKGVDFHLPVGSKTAIVGPSGSGKSTLLQMLMKMYPIQEGECSINGSPLNEINKEQLWEHTRIVLQHNHFFYGTIRDNLQIAGSDLADERLAEVLEQVKLDGFSLDDPVYEKGENLSGGEKQRLAIGRAVLKNGSLWLLDEPTSSLDAVTESEIHQLILHHSQDDTLVLVSHQLKGLEWMDQIIVMDGGEIVESGSFETLMAKKGYFYEMKQIEREVLA